MGGQQDRAAAILDRACRTTYHEQGDQVLINTYQDVEPHLEYAAKLRRADRERGRFAKKGDFRHAMSVPFNVILVAGQALGIANADILSNKDCADRIWKELQSPKYAKFRTVDGKL